MQAKTHPQHPRIGRHTPPLHALLPIQQIPPPNLLQLRITTPRSNRPLEALLHYIHKTRLTNQPRHILRNLKRLAGATGDFEGILAPARKCGVRGESSVCGAIVDRPFELFDVAAGFEVLVALPVEGGPVGDAAEEAADVDEVEVGGRVDPFACHVVDFEAAVVGLHAWLHRGEVGAYDFGVGELVCNVCSECQWLAECKSCFVSVPVAQMPVPVPVVWSACRSFSRVPDRLTQI